MEQNVEVPPSISLEQYSAEHEMSVENNKWNTHSKPVSKLPKKALDVSPEDYQKSVESMIKHMNMIKNHNHIRWFLNEVLSDLNKKFSMCHDIVGKLNRKVDRLKCNIKAYETMSETRNQDLRVAIEQIRTKQNSLNKEHVLRRTLENEYYDYEILMKSYENDYENCNKEITELRCQINNLNTNYRNSQTMCDIKIQEINNCNKEISELRCQRDTLTTNCRDTQVMYEMKIDELNKSIANLKTTKSALNQANLSNSKLAAENAALKEKVSSLETKSKNILVEKADMSIQTFLSGIRQVDRKKHTGASTAPSCASATTGEKRINIT